MRLSSLFSFALALGLAASASATPYTLSASIDGLQEAPVPVVTLGTGTLTGTYDDVTNALTWNVVYSGLIGAPSVAHLHGPGAVGVAAGVRVDIATLSGGISSPMIGGTTISDAFEAELLAGLWYVNIHSSAYPGGEIRGQVYATVVPEPGTAVLLLGGLLALALHRRR